MQVAKREIPLMRPLLPPVDALLPYLRQIDESRWYSNFGPMVDRFERRLAETLDLTYEDLVCVASGTIGLTVCLRALEPPQGSYCLMPAWTFAASALAVKWAGMEPWFLDVEEDTWMLEPDSVERQVGDIDGVIGAVMPVSAFGVPVDMVGWDRFRDNTGIPVVVDAAAAFDGAAFGRVPQVISLHATKVLGIGERALIASLDQDFSARVRAMSNFGLAGARESALVGTNAKISAYAAAVGMAALDLWPRTREKFLRAMALYKEAFADLPTLTVAPGLSKSQAHSTLNVRCMRTSAEDLMAALAAEGIASRQWWGKGCHRMPAFADARHAALPVTEMLAQSVVGLPFSQDTDRDEVRIVRDAIVRAESG